MNSGTNTEKIKGVRAEDLGTAGPDEDTPFTCVKKGDTNVNIVIFLLSFVCFGLLISCLNYSFEKNQIVPTVTVA